MSGNDWLRPVQADPRDTVRSQLRRGELVLTRDELRKCYPIFLAPPELPDPEDEQ